MMGSALLRSHKAHESILKMARGRPKGSPQVGGVPQSGIATFHDKYIPEPNSGCWLWVGCVLPRGYGIVYMGRAKRVYAHRLSWELHRGPIPEGLHVLHKCDVPCCVNPEHLFLGTQLDNIADMWAKGRARIVIGGKPGAANTAAKLTEAQACEIIASSESLSVTAARYGISKATVSHIRSGRTWGHLVV